MFSTGRHYSGRKFYNEFIYFTNFNFYLRIFTEVLIIMSSPGQKKGTCGHIMAVFDGHLKCARYREKGVADDPCVQSRFFNLLPPPTERGRTRRRRFLPPPSPL